MTLINKIIDDRFKIAGVIAEGGGSIVYRAEDLKTKKPVAVKILKKQQKDAENILRFKKESLITQKLSHKNIIKLIASGEYEDSVYIITEMVKGKSLEDLIRSKKPSLQQTLDIIEQTTEALDYAHQSNIIHRDLKPANIMFASGKIKIIDFCLARIMNFSEIDTKNEIVGTFSYMSPEQAGTINLLTDERSDLYSLGIIFYQMLTGDLPYKGGDIGGILHQHVAKIPLAPQEINQKVPTIISKICLKLMNKMPNERYQTAKGLLFDIKQAKELQKQKRIDEGFVLGQEDTVKKISYQTKFIGREKELSFLKNKIKDAEEERGSIVFISGYSGSGKTRLVEEIKALTEEKEIQFISGKCNKYEATLPYSPIIEALTEYINIINKEKKKKRETTINKIKNSLGNLSGAITQFVPAFEELIGKPEKLVHLDPEKEKIRFFDATFILLKTITSINKPLVIFLDDLQWMDFGTMELLGKLASKASSFNALIITSYRKEEVEQTHPLEELFNKLKQEKTDLNTIDLPPFTEKNTAEVIQKTFSLKNSPSDQLTNFVQERTNGNPFYIFQVLRSMVDQKVFVIRDQDWVFDENKLDSIKFPGTLFELLEKRVNSLPAQTVEILSIAATIGRDFSYSMLESITRISTEELLGTLDKALEQMLIWPKLALSKRSYTFSHDKIRESLYEKLPATVRSRMHNQIAKHIEKDDPDNIYELAHHYYKANNEEKALSYSVKAGDMSKQVFANEETLRFYNRALAIYSKNSGIKGSRLWKKLKEGIGDAYCLLGQYDKAIEVYQDIAPYAKNKLEKGILLERQALAIFENGDLKKGAEYYKEALWYFGVKTPKSLWGIFYLLFTQLTVHITHLIFPFVYSKAKYKNDLKAEHIIKSISKLSYIMWFINLLETLATHFLAINYAEHAGETQALAESYSNHAVAMSIIPWNKRALEYIDKSIAIANNINNPWSLALNYNFQGFVYYYMGEYDKAIESSGKASEGFSRAGDPWQKILAIIHIGYSYRNKSDFKKAEQYLKTAYENGLYLKDPRSIGQSLSGLCEVWAFSGETDKAEENIIKAIEASARAFDLLVLAMAYRDYAQILLLKDKPDQAIEQIELSKKIILKYFFRSDYATATYVVATDAYLKAAEKKFGKERKRLLNKAWRNLFWSHILSLSFKNYLGYTYRNRAIYDCLKNRFRTGKKYFDKSIRILEKQKNKFELGRTYFAAAKYLKGVKK